MTYEFSTHKPDPKDEVNARVSYLTTQNLVEGLPLEVHREREILATALCWPSRIDEALGLVADEDWAFARHRAIAIAMRSLHARGERLDAYTIRDEIGSALDNLGGVRAIAEIADSIGDEPTRLRAYAAAIREAAIVRRMAVEYERGVADIAQGYTDATADRLDALAEMQRQLDSLGMPDVELDDLDAWTAETYAGDPPPVEWLIPDIIARGEAHLLAAPGDSGKGFLTLEMGMQLASGVYETGRRAPFGHAILPLAQPSTVVLLYAEDSKAAVHRRLHALDPDGAKRARAGDRFRCVAMPSAGGAMSILERTQGGEFVTTARWRKMLERLAAMPDLGLVVIDPLSCFLALDIDSDSAVAQAAMGEMARAAATLNCAVLVAHHMRKAQEQHGPPQRVPDAPTHEGVRASIRGVAALLNGVRMAYGIVPMPGRYAKAILAKLKEPGEFDVGRVYWGAVVKANGKTDRRPRIYVRASYGLLEDRTSDLVAPGCRLDDVLRALVCPGGARDDA